MENDQNSEIEKLLAEYEKTLTWKSGGSVLERTQHCLDQYRNIANNGIYQNKTFLEDVKTQFKALEIITEGLTSDGLNHGQKRVIANHIITMLRRMVDKLDTVEYNYSVHSFERYNFFRSETPEKKLYEERANLSQVVRQQNEFINKLKEKFPLIYKDINNSDEIPF